MAPSYLSKRGVKMGAGFLKAAKTLLTRRDPTPVSFRKAPLCEGQKFLNSLSPL
jgi:hypothetical protein